MSNRALAAASRLLQREIHRLLRRSLRSAPTTFSPRERNLTFGGQRSTSEGEGSEPKPTAAGYPGDFTGALEIGYDPQPDGAPDPGEIVWAWVPFEEDHSRGKDRPVLLVGHDGPWLLALQLSRRDNAEDAARERRAGRIWVDIGSGAWDPQGRPSEVRVNRILRLDPDAIRREGAVLGEDAFARVAAAVQAARGDESRG